MKKFAVITILLLCTSCAFKTSHRKAIYFVHGQGELSSEELQAHPEVMVVQTFEELKKNASQKTAIWIDKSATPFDSTEEKWINEGPQAYSPIVLIGTSDTLYSFRDLLGLCCFMGPTGIYPGFNSAGFSIIQREPPADPTTAPMDVPFMQGYNQKPTVPSILEITNDLLEGILRPTPTVTFIPVVTDMP
jgi:hypothetical protein